MVNKDIRQQFTTLEAAGNTGSQIAQALLEAGFRIFDVAAVLNGEAGESDLSYAVVDSVTIDSTDETNGRPNALYVSDRRVTPIEHLNLMNHPAQLLHRVDVREV